MYRDVTVPVNRALEEVTSYAIANRYDMRTSNVGLMMHPGPIPYDTTNRIRTLVWFYEQMNHDAPWDIKEPERWVGTIGSTFPGSHDTPIYFRGERMTPESLGNWTYGYIGALIGLNLPTLLAGSYYAAGTPLPYSLKSIDDFNFGINMTSPIIQNPNFIRDFNNEMGDWVYIERGFNEYSTRRGRRWW